MTPSFPVPLGHTLIIALDDDDTYAPLEGCSIFAIPSGRLGVESEECEVLSFMDNEEPVYVFASFNSPLDFRAALVRYFGAGSVPPDFSPFFDSSEDRYIAWPT